MDRVQEIGINTCKICGKEIRDGNWVAVLIPKNKKKKASSYKRHNSC